MKLKPWVLTALLLLLPLEAVGQEASGQEASEPSFSEEIEVSVVNLEIVVTNKKGEPIKDIRRDEIEVLEDGKPVEITNFYVEEGTPSVSRDAPASQAPAVRSLDQRLSLVIFVDDINTEPQNRNRILGKVRELLPGMLAAGDRVMVVRFNNGGLEVIRPFTADVPQVASDLTAMEKLSGDQQRREETRNSMATQLSAALVGGWRGAEVLIDQYAAEESAQVRNALAGLDQVVGWIASLPGRKAMLYVSDGIPAVPGEELYLYAATRSGYRAGVRVSMLDSQGFDATKRFREVTSRASRSRVAFYTIETLGAHVERGETLQEHWIMNRQNGLRILAEETGGLAMLNAADPALVLRRMAADLSSYYSIGYRPQRPADDREHKIEVKVSRKGAVVRHRRWYKDKPVSETVADRTAATMVFGVEDNPLGASLEIGQQTAVPPENSSFVVPLRVKIPLSKLYLERKGEKRQGRLRLFVVASGEGKMTPVRETKLLQVDVPEKDLASGKAPDYVYEVRITLPQGTYQVGVGVRDEIATTTSYLQGKLEAGAKASDPASR